MKNNKQQKKNSNSEYRTLFLIILSLIEVIILIFNINTLYNFRKKTSYNYRNVDYSFLKIILSSFQSFANNLTKTFKPNVLNKLDNNTQVYSDTRKKVKLYYKNINVRWINLIKEDVKEKIEIEINHDEPDYLVYGNFGCEHALNKYNNTIRIAFYAENQIPDLNIADYAIGMSHINYLDRFFTFPYLVYFLSFKNRTLKDYDRIRQNVLMSQNRTKFCAAVISNPIGFRLSFIKELNKYKTIDHGGKYHNNVGGRVKSKSLFLSEYKFSFGMENSEADGYATEKILDSLWAGTIPIYYGDYTIDEYINPKTYILIRDGGDMNEKIEYIKKIDNDDNLYRSIMKEKVFIDESFVDNIINERKKFLIHIFEQEKKYAKRVDKYHFNYKDG